MSIAGVALDDGGLLWVHTELSVEPLDRVLIRLLDAEVAGTVLVAPDQVLRPPVEVNGTVIHVLWTPSIEPDCADLPGADLPPLGLRVRAAGMTGIVTALDPVAARVTVVPEDGGEPIECQGAEIESLLPALTREDTPRQ